jgi:HSP20 family protein
MALTRQHPSQELQNLQEGFNRLINHNLARLLGDEEGLLSTAWMPPVDICENENYVVIEADVPGMKPEQISLTVENNVLTLRGERSLEQKGEGDNYHRIERSYGNFTRTFALPPTVNTETVQAHYENGVLRVTLAKREEAKPRQIQVSVSTEAQGEQGRLKAATSKSK